MELDEVIKVAHQAGHGLWPAVALSLEQMATLAHAAGVTVDGLTANGTDFYLAAAATLGLRQAIETIDRRFIAPAAPRLRQTGASPPEIADALQIARERLFVGPNPKIRTYNAIGPLAQWIRIIAVRAVVDLHRQQNPRRNAEARLADEPPVAVTADPVVQLTKDRFRQEFVAALEAYLPTLPVRERTILRLYLIEGVSVQQIGVSYKVNRSTVTRWIWAASEGLLDNLQRHFKDRFGLVPSECESVARLVQSQVHVDLQRLLAANSSRSRP